MSLATSQKQSRGGGCCGGSKKSQNKLAANKGLKVKQNYVPSSNQGGKLGNPGLGAANNAARNGGDEVVKETIEAKLVLIGDSSVGKSSIAGRFQMGNFQDVYQSTIGGAYFQKELFVPESELIDENAEDYHQQMSNAQGHQRVKLHIWDTGGQEQFRSMLSLYYRDADAALICFDLSNPKSLQSVFYWVEEMNNNCNNDRTNFVLALAGNKCDLDDSMKKITYGTATEVAEQHNMIYHETSAKTGAGVKDIFNEIVRDIIKCKRKNQQYS